MHRLEDRRVGADVCAGRKTQTADQTRTQVRDDVAEQIGRDQHVELPRVQHKLHAGVVDDHLVVLDVGILRRHLARDLEEQSRGRFQDVRLVHDRDFLALRAAREFERVPHDALGALACDLLRQRRGIAVGRDLLAFADIRAFGIFAHGEDVDVLVARFGRRKRNRRAHVGIQVKALAQGHIDRGEAFSDRRGDGALQPNVGTFNRLDQFLGNIFVILLKGLGAGLKDLPLELEAGCFQNTDNRRCNFRADTIARDQCDFVRHEKN